MKGKLLWGKRFLHHCWWNDFPGQAGGGNLYFCVPYELELGEMLYDSKDDIEKVLIERCMKDPDISKCAVEMGSIFNRHATSTKWVTAIVVTNNRKTFDKLSQYSNTPTV